MSCIAPFLLETAYNNSKGYIDGRMCSNLTGPMCCLPCPLTDWVYPDSFNTLGVATDWVAVASTVCCVALLLSWLVLPVDKTHRHHLSICLTSAVFLMNLGFILPLAARPEQCADAITPNGMQSNSVCAASGTFLILGGWAGIMWVFLRSLSLHLQICWQVVVGRSFMYLSFATGWGIPILGTVLAIVFSGVSFRFGTTCHINHNNSLADLWIPLLVFAGLTIVVQLVTFGYCIKVYLAALNDNTASTENSGLPSYSNSLRTMTPRQAYRRVRRVIQLQWRGIAIVLIIITDVIFFSIIFVFQDNTVEKISTDPKRATSWLVCLATHGGDKNKCLTLAKPFVVNEATIGAVLVLLAMNGFWLLFLLGRWSMVQGWVDLLTPASAASSKREFVSVDARLDDLKKDTRSYEMLSRDASSSMLGAQGPMMKGDDLITSFSSTTGVASPAATAAMSPTSPGGAGGAGGRMTPLSPGGSIRSPTPLMDLQSASAIGAARESGTGYGNSGYAASHSRYGSHGSHGRYGSYSSNTAAGTGAGGTTTTTITAGANGRAAGTAASSGRRTPDYFGQTARYNAPARSFSIPRPSTATSATGAGPGPSNTRWDARDTYAAPTSPERTNTMRSTQGRGFRGDAVPEHDDEYDAVDNRHPLGMNRI
ncbi:GPCR, family 2, secretin-like protein [Niveomyces insectorum RCEF 264]|uniref:GPCR, family 2, secretin-like protein n=1 Tax=Niveomyces insectorum RCEF 264 TaxID=1081102 RepID=A0A168AAM5_9HYPO|nr:GPCR, family 2, secretin-like protein [Niveomyces insectorum RCEF 264]